MALRKSLFSILLLLPLFAVAQTDSIQLAAGSQEPKTNWFNRGVNSVLTEFAFSGIPLTVGSHALRPSKVGFRQNNPDVDSRTQLLHNFSTSVDNYIQYTPIAAATIMNMVGYEGHSSRLRYVGTAAASYAIMAGLVNILKYTVKEMRPDGSSANAWPSGHTATVFVGATILHHEYGLTRSPWYSVGGYTVATATAALRVMNNRHWVSDVFAGAGIGIVSTDAAYVLADFIFRNKGINRPYKDNNADLLEHPSFVGITEGFGVVRHSVSLGGKTYKFGFPVAAGVEGAYLFSRYVGAGGRLQLATSSLRNSTLQDQFLTSFSYSVGPYLRYPFSNKLALGTKLLVGKEHNTGMVDSDTKDYLSVSNNLTCGTGISLNYAYKNLCMWTLFCDYDLSPRTYILNNKYKLKRNVNSLTLGARVNISF